MARAYAEPKEQAAAPTTPADDETRSAVARVAAAPQRAYELTDPRGHRAYLWRVEYKWIVEADDSAFRRRIMRALKKPIWSREDELDEFGVRWSTLVRMDSDDPRYANRLYWNWDQIGLDDIAAEVVTLPDRRPIRHSRTPAV
jgi:hypothetical protein